MSTQKQGTKVLEENNRANKGLVLAGRSLVRKIEPQTTGATLYKVRSERGDNEYSVIVHTDGSLTCECLDFVHRNATCKHIYAVVFSDQMGFTVISRRKPEKIDISGSDFTL